MEAVVFRDARARVTGHAPMVAEETAAGNALVAAGRVQQDARAVLLGALAAAETARRHVARLAGQGAPQIALLIQVAVVVHQIALEDAVPRAIRSVLMGAPAHAVHPVIKHVHLGVTAQTAQAVVATHAVLIAHKTAHRGVMERVAPPAIWAVPQVVPVIVQVAVGVVALGVHHPALPIILHQAQVVPRMALERPIREPLMGRLQRLLQLLKLVVFLPNSI